MNRTRVAQVALSTAVVLFGGIFVAGIVFARNLSRDTIADARKPYDTHGAKFLEDQRAIEAAPPFPLAGSEKDAGPYLNPRVSWYGKQSLVDEFASTASLRPPQTVLDRLASYRGNWADHADDVELTSVDLSWMKALEAYDYWDVDDNGPAKDPTRYAAWDKPLPGVSVFIPAATLRLLQGLRDGDARPAAREVRHAARLLHSTESDVAAVVAVNLLELERVAYEKQKATKGDASVEGWNVVDAISSARLRRVATTYPAFAELYAPSDLSAKAFEHKGPTWARCAALNQGLGHTLMTRALLESAMGTRLDELAGLLRSTEGECRLHALRTAWKNHPNAYGAFTGTRAELCAEGSKTPFVCRPWLFAHLIPGGRAAVGHTLASLATTSFQFYAPPGFSPGVIGSPEMVVCTSCGAEGDGKFCGTCGAKMPEEKPKARELSRPNFAPFAVRIEGAIPSGSKVTVAANETFYGVLFGSVHTTYDKGTHETEDELEGGWFIVKDGVDLAFDDDLGILEDNKGQRGRVTVSGTVRARIDEPNDFVADHGGEDLDIGAMSQRVRAKVRELIESELRNLLAKDRYLTSLQSSKMLDVLKKDVLSAWIADVERDVFVAIELPKVIVRTQTLSEAPPPTVEPEPETKLEIPKPAAVPQASAAPAFETGARVDVVWSDGQRYPATVRTSGCLVRFDDGQEHWIPLESLARPKD